MLSVKILLKDFKEMIRRTAFCAGADGNDSCSGVFLEKHCGSLVMAATNNRRLGFAKMDAGDALPDFGRIMVSVSVLKKIAKLKADTSTLSISVSDKEVCFCIGSTSITAKRLSCRLGGFPQNQEEFPRIFPLSFTVDRLSFLEALRMVSLVIDLNLGHPVYASLSPGLLALRTDYDGESAEVEEIPCGYSGEKTEAVFNTRYIREVTEHIHTECVTIRFADDHLNVAVLPEPQHDYFYLFAQTRRD